MNERIRELAHQVAWSTDTSYDELTKFAELIAQECATVVSSVPPCFGDYRDQIEVKMRDYCAQKIKEHFGVKP